MKTWLNGHKVEIEQENDNLSFVIIDDKARLQQIHHGKGKMVLTGTAWDEEQKDIIAETFPNMAVEEDFSDGLTIWRFRSENS
jgi:hypothetical protein